MLEDILIYTVVILGSALGLLGNIAMALGRPRRRWHGNSPGARQARQARRIDHWGRM